MPFITNEQLEFLRYNCEWEVGFNHPEHLQTVDPIDGLGYFCIYPDGRVFCGDKIWDVENVEYVKMTHREIMKRTRSSSRYHVSPEEEALAKFIERSKL